MTVTELLHRLGRMVNSAEDMAEDVASVERLYETCGYEGDADTQFLARSYVALTIHLVNVTKESMVALSRYAVTGQDDAQAYFRAWKHKLLPMIEEIESYVSSAKELQK